MSSENLAEKILLDKLNSKNIQKKRCKICNNLKKRIFDGMFDEKNKRWKGEDGLIWNGLVCGSCHQDKMRRQMRVKREKTEQVPETT